MNYLLELPLALGIHGTYKGYRYLIFALELALADENQLLYVTKNLYPSVARRYHTTPSCVDRDLRTVINRCWNSCGRAHLQRIASYTLDKCPTVSEFLDILYWHLKKKGL